MPPSTAKAEEVRAERSQEVPIPAVLRPPSSPAPAAAEVPSPKKEEVSVIAAGTQLRGALAFSGVLVVNGRFLGELSSPEGTALVGAKGEVQAQIDAAELRVEGKVKGNIFARGSLELRAGADVQGTIRCVRLLIEEEAYFQGHCECVRPPRQEPEGAPNRPDMYAFFAAARVALAWR